MYLYGIGFLQRVSVGKNHCADGMEAVMIPCVQAILGGGRPEVGGTCQVAEQVCYVQMCNGSER